MKSTQATVRQRVEEVLDPLLLGAALHEIRQSASSPERKPGPWNVTDRQLQRYVAQADDLLSERLDHDRRRLFNRHVAARRALFARAVGAADYRTALAAPRDEAELYRLYPPRALEVSGPAGRCGWASRSCPTTSSRRHRPG